MRNIGYFWKPYVSSLRCNIDCFLPVETIVCFDLQTLIVKKDQSF